MSDHENAVLARELGKLGRLSSGTGGDGAGAAWGTRLVAQFLPVERQVVEVSVPFGPERTLRSLLRFFTEQGRVLLDDNDDTAAAQATDAAGDSPFPKISGVVGAGFFNLNPALVHVELLNTTSTDCQLQIAAAAKEGLWKQQTAAKAADRLVAWLHSE